MPVARTPGQLLDVTMNATLKRKFAIGTTVLAAAAFAGGAYAATTTSPTNLRQTFLNDVAKRLGVTPAQLQDAFKGAFLDQLQAAVTAGKLTQAQADAIKKRIQQGGGPFGAGPLGAPGFVPGFFHAGPGFFRGPRFFPKPGGGAVPAPFPFPGPAGPPGAAPPPFPGPPAGGRFSAAASYLGLSETQLFNQLRSGKSLAQIAAAQHKSVTGLTAAMTAAIKSRLDKAVAAKLLTSAQEQKLLSVLSSRLAAEINAKPFAGAPRFRGRMRVFPAYPVPPASGPVPVPAPSGPVY